MGRLGALLLVLLSAADALRFAFASHRRPTALPRRVAAVRAQEADEDALFEAELRKAMGNMPTDELRESDRRSMDALVEEQSKGEFNAFESSFDSQLQSVQGAIESRLEETTRQLEGETMARIDAAVEALRRDAKAKGLDSLPSSRDAPGGEALDGLAADELPPGALVVVAGGGTALGRETLRLLGAAGDLSLRSLELDGAPPAGDADVDTREFAPFAPTALKRDLEGAAAVVVVSAEAGGKGGVEPAAVGRLAKALGGGVRRLVFVSSHGTLRAAQLPFSLRNLFGQLDKLRAAEQEIVLRATRDVPAHSIVRLGKLTPTEARGDGRATLAPGDAFDAPCSLGGAAVAVAATLRRPEVVNATFSLTQEAPGAVSADAGWWEDEWLKLVGPEILRIPLSQLSAPAAAEWLREWARGLLRPGRGLTTPIEVEDLPDGALLRFLQGAGTGYDDLDAEDDDDGDAWRRKGQAAPAGPSRDKPDGALRLVAEAEPFARVRVCRAEMGPGVQVKEMSETAVLSRLAKDLKALEGKAK